MDLSDFDPYHPSNNAPPITSTTSTPPTRLFQTPPPIFNSSLTSTSRLHSNTPPPPPPLPSKPVKQDPLDAFDLLSFDDSNSNASNLSIQPSIAAHNLRQEVTMRDLNRDPWSSFSEASSSTNNIAHSFLLPPPGSIATQPQTINRDLNNTANTSTSSHSFSSTSSNSPHADNHTSHNSHLSRISTSQLNPSNPSISRLDSFQPFNNVEEGNQHPNGSEGGADLANQVEEEDWWSGFQSGTVSPQEDVNINSNDNNISTNGEKNVGQIIEQQEVKRSQKSEQYRQRMMRGMKGKEREKPLPLPTKQDREDSYIRTDDWDFNAGGVDTLQPIHLLGVPADEHRALNEEIAEGIRPHLPPRLRVSRKWNLIYSLDQHGISISTMYERMGQELAYSDGGVVLVVKDGSGSIFGAYVNQGLQELNHYYGDGSCFLWKSTPFEDSDFRVGSSIKTFKWTGKNDYLILTESTFLSVGGGNGKFGLWVDSVFEKGFSAKCPCFDNEPLTAKYEKGVLDGEEAKFDVVMFECWAVDK